MDKKIYNNFCYKHDIDPTDYDNVLFTVDELEGMYGDKDGKLQNIREYVYDKIDGDLSYSKDDYSFEDDAKNTKEVGVYQIKNTRSCNYAFMSYEFALESGGVDMELYNKVATVNVSVRDDDTVNDILDIVFAYGNSNPRYYADNPTARSISVSDILEYDGEFYYVDSTGFQKIDTNETITEAVETDLEKESDVDITDDKDDRDYDKTALDYLDDLQDRQMTVAELNVVLQSIFGRFNDIFLIESDLYNADLDETQELDIWDDDDLYVIEYDIIDVQDGIIEITKSTLK